MADMQLHIDGNGVVRSPLHVTIPAVDLFSYIVSSGDPISRQSRQYFDAAAPSRNLSLEEATMMAKRFGKGLQQQGLKKQDKVLIAAPNDIFHPVVLWGVIAAGGVFTGCSPTSSLHELEYQLRDSEARFLVVASECVGVATDAADKAGVPRANIFLLGSEPSKDQSPAQPRSWEDIFVSEQEAESWQWVKISSLSEATSTTAVINYSSGSTGIPKGVELTHYNIIANAEQVALKRSQVANTSCGRAREERAQISGDRWLAAVPMYHAFGQSYFCVIAPRLQAKVFTMPKFDLTRYLTFADIYRITFLNVVPAMMAMFCRVENPGRFNLKSANLVISGAAPLDAASARQFQHLYLRPGTCVKQGWGMTETTCQFIGFAPDDMDDGRSIGWLNPNCKARIVPVPGREFGRGPKGEQVGELWAAGPNVMRGYWKREKETADTFVSEHGERWLRTGDVGYVDDRGCFYIVDRLKELIKVNGLQVSPAELEGGLMGVPGVKDAGVVGAKRDGREFPQAFVVRENNDVTAEKLHSFVQARFARHKWLTGGIFFVNSIPRNPSGKIVRRALPSPTAAKL